MHPLVSIITVNRNNRDGLKKTIESVSRQDFKNFEFIIVDGASSDGSVEIISQHSNSFSWWVSEQDSGIYNAMNKGLAKASGDYLFFLNSGDCLAGPAILQTLAPFLNGTHIVYGDLIIAEKDHQWVKKYDGRITFSYFFYDTLPHQGSFIHKSIISKVGIYDESLNICADWKFFLDAICLHNATLKYIDSIITVYDHNGISARPGSHELMTKEKFGVFEKYYSRFLPDLLDLDELRKKYPPLANSRAIKTYLSIRSTILGWIGRR